jgi:pyridoxine 4-dehydrogenase
LDESVGALADLQRQGKIRHIGLSNVDEKQLAAAQKIVPIVTVQNRYNLTDRASEGLVDICERADIGFIPWFPLATGQLPQSGTALDTVAHTHRATFSQIALAWLLKRSRVMLPIPGTSSAKHLEENIAGARIQLTDAEFKQLSALHGQ